MRLVKPGDEAAGTGAAVASLLRGAWRPDAPSPAVQEVALAADALAPLGAAALAWWRLRHTPHAKTPAVQRLRVAYQYHAAHAALYAHQLNCVAALLQQHRLRALLLKGWAVARCYPQPWLRPFGDIDLLVDPKDLPRARALFAAQHLYVDVQGTFQLLEDRPFADLWQRRVTLPCGDNELASLGAEDHLRLLMLHLLRHGGQRAIWWVDIALLGEGLTEAFDWALCLRGDSWVQGWMAAIWELSRELLGGRGAPMRGAVVPDWLRRCVLGEWGRGACQPERPLRTYLREPRGVGHALAQRWPTMLQAMVELRRPVDGLPWGGLQLGTVGVRVTRVIQRRRQPDDFSAG